MISSNIRIVEKLHFLSKRHIQMGIKSESTWLFRHNPFKPERDLNVNQLYPVQKGLNPKIILYLICTA